MFFKNCTIRKLEGECIAYMAYITVRVYRFCYKRVVINLYVNVRNLFKKNFKLGNKKRKDNIWGIFFKVYKFVKVNVRNWINKIKINKN